MSPNLFTQNRAPAVKPLPMNPNPTPQICPECSETVPPMNGLARRNFIRAVGVMGGAALLPSVAKAAPAEKPRAAKPAETLVREFFATLTPEQRKAVVQPWNHGAEKVANRRASRLTTRRRWARSSASSSPRRNRNSSR